MNLNVHNLCVVFGKRRILQDVSFSIDGYKTLAVMGRNGAGKTTLLRAIAGLVNYMGVVQLDKEDQKDVAVWKRDFGMVTQEDTLFPHLTVQENVAYPLTIRDVNKSSIKDRVSLLLKRFKVGSLADRYPQEISGGQRQKISLARAIVYNPRLLLFDEPFAQLDPVARYDLIVWLKAVLQREKTASIYVTHYRKEAVYIGDRILFLQKGRSEFFKTPRELKKSSNKLIKDFLNKSFD